MFLRVSSPFTVIYKEFVEAQTEAAVGYHPRTLYQVRQNPYRETSVWGIIGNVQNHIMFILCSYLLHILDPQGPPKAPPRPPPHPPRCGHTKKTTALPKFVYGPIKPQGNPNSPPGEPERTTRDTTHTERTYGRFSSEKKNTNTNKKQQ